MRRTYEDYAGDRLTVTSHDKQQYVTLEIECLVTPADGMFDLNANQVDDLIHQLTQWKRLQPIDPIRMRGESV